MEILFSGMDGHSDVSVVESRIDNKLTNLIGFR